ncbi:MAG: carbohydrate binding domain-containing protein [Verrucomicrobiales bacterium]
MPSASPPPATPTGYLTAALADAKPAGAPEPAKEEPKPENLVQNPGFETIAGNLPKMWQVRTYSGSADHAAVQPGRGGKGYCLMIESKDGSDSSMFLDIPVRKGTRYRLSAWVKTEGLGTRNNGRGAQLNIHALPGQPRTKALKGDNDWTQVDVEFETGGADNIGINCLYGGWGHATGKAYWDDIELIELGPGKGGAAAQGDDPAEIAAANLRKNTTPEQRPKSPSPTPTDLEQNPQNRYTVATVAYRSPVETINATSRKPTRSSRSAVEGPVRQQELKPVPS